MINIIARTKSELITNPPIERLSQDNISWYWVDFNSPIDEEAALLRTHFMFSELSIDDCLERLERPKVDYYDTYNFFVLNALEEDNLEPVELDIFVGQNYIVTFHKVRLMEIDDARNKILNSASNIKDGPVSIFYEILDKVVDRYFPVVYRLEDTVNDIDLQTLNGSMYDLIDRIFEIRTDLLKLRQIVNSMKELLYRIISSEHLENFKGRKRHFNDIYDHLLRLSDIIESSREITADARDSYLSINSHKMNRVMMLLTVITTIFIPLTFIVGVYGMNFAYMPELKWRYGYFIILGVMAAIAVAMIIWFRRKGWFNMKK